MCKKASRRKVILCFSHDKGLTVLVEKQRQPAWSKMLRWTSAQGHNAVSQLHVGDCRNLLART